VPSQDPETEHLEPPAPPEPRTRPARAEPLGEPKKKRSFWKELPVLIFVAFLVALLIKTFLLQAFFIPSASMEPTLKVGDRVLVEKVSDWWGSPARGDVVVFEREVGAMGAIVFPGDIPEDLGEGVTVPGFPVEVFNSVGAGDAFLSGFLSGWLRDEPLEECLRLGNACGAIVVSRHGCSPAMPTPQELEYFLEMPERPRRLRDDAWLEHLHRTTTRREPSELRVLAIDHRWQLEDVADELGVDRGRLRALKVLLARAFLEIAGGDPSAGVLIDDVYGGEALEELTGSGVWVSRAAEVAGSRPVEFVGGANPSATIRTWPEEHVVKCNLYMHPQDDAQTKELQEGRVLQLYDACIKSERRLLLEVQAPSGTSYDDNSIVGLLERFYEIGVRPDWWKVPPNKEPGVWRRIGDVVREHDPYCAGILVLGQALEEGDLAEYFAAAASEQRCNGFAIGRSIYGKAARRWLSGEIDDEELMSSVAERYERMVELWQLRNEGSEVVR